MGSYGFPIGEGVRFKVYMHANVSGEYPKIYFSFKDKETNQDVEFQEWAEANYDGELNKALKDLEEGYSLFFIKDKILHEKAKFEREFLDMQQRIKELEKANTLLQLRLDVIKRFIEREA